MGIGRAGGGRDGASRSLKRRRILGRCEMATIRTRSGEDTEAGKSGFCRVGQSRPLSAVADAKRTWFCRDRRRCSCRNSQRGWRANRLAAREGLDDAAGALPAVLRDGALAERDRLARRVARRGDRERLQRAFAHRAADAGEVEAARDQPRERRIVEQRR